MLYECTSINPSLFQLLYDVIGFIQLEVGKAGVGEFVLVHQLDQLMELLHGEDAIAVH